MSSVPVVPEIHTHVLAEFDCLDPLLSTLRLDSGRLKCTSLAVSRKWLALGTSAGGLHLIQREGWKQRLILTHKEGSITHVACCPHDEDFIAVALSHGLVVIWELHLERRGRPERVSTSWEHRGHAVTALCWDTSVLRVFVGDSGGKVSCLRGASSKLGKGSAFVIFPVQTVATVDSKVVQLGYQEGRLLVSSLSRVYLCDTEKEKFWRVGHKERDGEFGACFFPQNKGLLAGQPPLLYCARPGSRIWEASFNGDVLSTHQFKQLLACTPLPLITFRNEPHYNQSNRSPQSLAFPKLLYFGDQNLLTWTDSAIFIFTPHNGQVLLWTEVKDVVDVVTYRSELFCLHSSGRLSHVSLLSAERCVERLLRRESWLLAAAVCVMFQHTIITSRARKSTPIDRLENLKSQLSTSANHQLLGQLEEVIAKLEPLDSASSSRRSSISSHDSFNVLDCGIYRVISRRGSQSDEETGSFINHSMSEEERLKDFSFVQDDDQVDPDLHNHERMEGVRSDQGLPFHLPLSFRAKPPRIALQAVKDSVSSFVKKTTEKINTLQMNSDLRPRPDLASGETSVTAATFTEEIENESYDEMSSTEADLLELRSATERALRQTQDPTILLDPVCLKEALLEWVPVLERVLGPTESSLSASGSSDVDAPEERRWDKDAQTSSGQFEDAAVPEESEIPPRLTEDDQTSVTQINTPELIRAVPPASLPSDLQADLTQLATLHIELSCFGNQPESRELSCDTFLRRYFFLLDQERVGRMTLLCPLLEVKRSFIEAMLDVTQSSKVVEVIQRGDLQRSLRFLRELQPWSSPSLLAHLHRLYEKHGEAALRSIPQFHPAITPADVTLMAGRRHFLAYLDNLVQAQPEDDRSSFLRSLLEPQSLQHDWLELALTHDAPQRCDTMTSDGQPRWHSHRFSWGYGRLLSLLIQLPADLTSKQKMADSCRSHGYWTGYLALCRQLQLRPEAFSTVCLLDDITLLEEPQGLKPESLDEWKLLIRLCRGGGGAGSQESTGMNGGGPMMNGSADGRGKVDLENLTLMLAQTVGPDRALEVLKECEVQMVLSPHAKLVCELLRVTEKRQRATIQTMLERCDRFLWSQHA